MQEPRKRAARGASRAAIAIAVSAALVTAGVTSANAATTNPSPGALETQNGQLSKRAATEGMVLLENNGTLPIAKTGNVAVFGVGAYKTVKGGTGSGDVNNRYTVSARQGLENAGYTVTTNDTYYNAMSKAYEDKYGTVNTGAVGGVDINYSSVEQALTTTTVQPTAATDTAVYVLPRTSGEGLDRKAIKGDYELGDTERANIELLGKTYAKVIVALNVGGIVDTAWYDQINGAETDPTGGTAIDSLLLMSQGGQETGNALVQVLNGTVTPSGKLTDTWASKYSYYPASKTFGSNDGNALLENYTEGIYVGYRYFDSFAKSIDPANTDSVVDYPFGYGLSYSDFQIQTQSVAADINTVTVKARVTNVGKEFTGKEVVEVYASAPQTGLDKPYQTLAGYAKTDALAPGSAQVVTITFDTSSLASYDVTKAANVLDAGDYTIRVGNSSRNTQVASVLSLGSTTTVEKLSNEGDGSDPALDLTSNPNDFYSYPSEADETKAAPRISVSTAGFVAPDNSSDTQQDVTVDSSSPYFTVDGSKISSTTALIPTDQTTWENTGAPYVAKAGETVKKVATDPANTLFDVAAGDVSMESFVAGLSVTQLANIVEGANVKGSTLAATGAAGYTTSKYESLGVSGMTLADGPAGVRITKQIASSPVSYQYATAFPIGTSLAQTWNTELVEEVGAAIGREMIEYGATLWLAPGMNLHRDPLNGRNFEYFSEDPLVTGLIATAETKGVQSNPGVGVTIKHYAGNQQETSRNAVNDVVSERALRELYLKGFEIAVKSARPMAVMNSYNKINGSYTAASWDLNTDIMRGEWGFTGLIMTDWGGVSQSGVVPTLYSGNDLIMPGNSPQAVINGLILVAPSIDSNGTPVYTKSVTPTRTSYTLQTGGLTLAATGGETFSTTIDGTTNLSQVSQSNVITTDTINNQTVVQVPAYGTVNAAYTAATTLRSALSTAQQAAITISDVVYQTAGDTTTPVVSYKVTVKGNYPAATTRTLRLGDVQRAASHVLGVVSQSASFAELAGIQKVSGVTAQPYAEQFGDLHQAVTVTRGTVVAAQTGNGPSVSIATTPGTPASGWFTGDVTVKVATDDGAQAYIDVDSGELRPYTEPVIITGEGTHVVRAIAVGEDGLFSTLKETTVKIDATKPTVTATGSKGLLTLTASDALSGVGTVEYSVDGTTWAKYTAPVAIAGAPKTVSYRAADVAGNVSASASVAVEAAPANATAPAVTKQPVAKTTVKSGKKVTLTATASGTPTPVVQWQVSTNSGKSWKNIAGATKTSYSFTAKASLTGNKYRATFTNAAGSTVSSVSTVTVKIVTVAKAKLADRSITSKQKAKVSVTVAPTSKKPTGTVTVHYGSKSVSAKLKASDKGTVTVSLPKLKKGKYKVYVEYEGSSTFAADNSTKTTLVVK